MSAAIPRFVLRQRVLFNILFFVLMFAGLFAAREMAVDAYPNVDLDAAAIQTVWIGASPEEVDTLVTKKIVDELEGIRGVDRTLADSRPNRSSVLVKFDESLSDAELDRAFQDVRAALDRVADLPPDAEEPELRRQTVFEIFPLVSIGVGYDVPEREGVAREVARALREELLRIDGVAKVDDRNLRDPEFTVLLDRERLDRHDLTVEEVVAALETTNRNIPAGSVRAGAEGELALRAAGNYRAARDVEETVVRRDPGGAHLRVRDVGRVERGFEERDVKSRFNGRDAILLPVAKDDGENSLRLLDEVRARLDAFRARGLPEGIDVGVAIDSSQIIRDRLSVLLANLGQGMVLVFGVLWFGIGVRNAILAIVGIPFSFLVAFLLMNAMGVSINAISLFALVLVSGVDVDDAIVILENIHRHRERGLSRADAIVEACREVFWPVVNSTATTVAAFLPMLLTVGVVGEFFAIIPKVVTAVLAGSLFQAFAMLPIHAFDFWGGGRGTRPAPGRARALLGGLYRRYDALLALCLRHRGAVLAVLLAASLLAVALWGRLDTVLFPSDFQIYLVNMEMPADAALEDTSDAARGVDAVLARVNAEGPFAGQIESWTTQMGVVFTEDNYAVIAPHIAQTFVSLRQGTGVDPSDVKDYTARLLDRIRIRPVGSEEEAVAARLRRFRKLTAEAQQDGPPTGKPVAVRVRCDDLDRAEEVAAAIKAELSRLEGVREIVDNHDEGRVEYSVMLRESLASAHGIDFRRAALALAAANDGVVVSVFKDPGGVDDADVRVRLRPEDRRSVEDLARVRLRTRAGATVPLGSVARIDAARGHAGIYRYDGRRTVLVTASIDERTTTAVEVNRSLERRFGTPEFRAANPDVTLWFGGEFEETRKSFRSLGEAFLVAVFAIYMLLAAQFKSYARPLVIMLTVPFAFIGVVVGLYVTGNPFTIMAGIAMIGLTGLVVNGAIVLLEFARQRVEAGLSPEDAIRDACRVRARPILLTTVTTIAGLLPTALGLAGFSKLWGPFAATMCFGLAFATLLTLFVVPSGYLVVEGWRRRRGAGAGRG